VKTGDRDRGSGVGTKEDAPSCLRLFQTGELERVLELEAMLESCQVCPLDCGNNRIEDEIARCYSGRLPIVSSYTAHFGEEPALTGTCGAGNIFFGNCDCGNNLRNINNLREIAATVYGYGSNTR
jgi:uncharacterized Fe-S radical SAM superfamily protein PflX